MQNFRLIIRPVITEKATASEKEGKYQFLVRGEATKIDIRQAFEAIYGVHVTKINVMRTPGKTRIGKTRAPSRKRREYKKVIISTKGKKTVDISKPKFK